MKHTVITELEKLGCFCFPTGSQYICDPPPPTADEDWIIATTPAADYGDLLNVMAMHDMERVTSAVEYDCPEEGGPTQPFKRQSDNLNLIMINKPDVAARWIAATIYCKRLNVQSREERIAIFRAFRNDTPLPTTPEGDQNEQRWNDQNR